jgi:DNA-directed RNA polymerase specialized sigma24 family protein
MREQTLKEFLETHTQKEAADAIGCTQGAVWQMLKNRRDIRFRLNKKGEPVSFYEIKKPKVRAA